MNKIRFEQTFDYKTKKLKQARKTLELVKYK